jgi:hypothetical protein
MSLHAQISPEVKAALAAQKRNSTIASIVVGLFLMTLIVLLFWLNVILIFTEKAVPIVSYASEDVPEEVIEKVRITNSVKKKPSSPSSSPSPVITAAAPSPVAIPVPEITVDTLSTDFGAAEGFGDGWGDGWSSGNGGSSGSLFGRKVKSSNLGVVLDVSGSAHPHLDKAISEIDKSFPKAHIVFVVGCGMSDGKGAFAGGGGKVPGKPRVVTYKNIDTEKQYNSLARSAPGQLEMFFKKAGEKRAKELRKHFERRDNLYALYVADIHGTNFAFDFLLDNNVDTIYWFADFADSIDDKTIKDLTKQLTKSGVTVISHNFMGKPVGKLATEMTKKTGGETFSLVPGQEEK